MSSTWECFVVLWYPLLKSGLQLASNVRSFAAQLSVDGFAVE